MRFYRQRLRMILRKIGLPAWLLFSIGLLVTATVYWPGLSGSWLFDDYANIVDNKGVQPGSVGVGSLVSAMLSSPASELKRPLASLSFSVNYLMSGLMPFGWKLVNLTIHLLNGLLVFVLARLLLTHATYSSAVSKKQRDMISALLATGWLLLPINLTAALYIVQREESLANLFVIIGLIGYITARSRLLANDSRYGFLACVLSLVVPTVIGMAAKETTVMLPLYAIATEWLLFGFQKTPTDAGTIKAYDFRIFGLFLFALVIPGIIGMAWALPRVVSSNAWMARNFTLQTRLLSEMRVVCDYLQWTLLPSPQTLSFYHDDFKASTSLLSPWTTLVSALVLLALVLAMFVLRHRFVLISLGIAFFLGGQLLTATVFPLELVFEHRNYFASFGVLLAILPPLLSTTTVGTVAHTGAAKLRHAIAAILLINWTTQTATTAYAWGNPLRLSEELAVRAPASPRAQYELGRTYVILSQYNPTSPFTRLAREALGRAASLPGSTILPEQGLIFLNSRMHVPLEERWWDSMVAKLYSRKSTVEDESAIEQLSTCQTNGQCDLPKQKMLDVYLAALSHPNPSARLLNMYGMYAWEELYDHSLGIRMLKEAVLTNPQEPAYRVTLVRMLTEEGHLDEARLALNQLAQFNLAGHMNEGITTLRLGIAAKEKALTARPAHSASG